MEDSLTKEIDNSNNELIKLVKFHVEDILSKHFDDTGILIGYDLRDDAIYHTVERVIKKYLNDSRFETKKDVFIRTIAMSYIFGYGIDSRHKSENNLDIP
jgi:hypothetical protein